MKIKTMELNGEALDFAVALIEYPEWKDQGYLEDFYDLKFDDGEVYSPSTDWAQGGPIIERERICVMPADEDLGTYWGAGKRSTNLYTGDTHLIAAMRYYVGCNLGDEVDIPEGLV